jgi:N-acetylglutamate synthase-like GNAT family acetyltransferase
MGASESYVLIEIQRLHPSEFDLLKEFEDGFTPDPSRSVVVVARNDSRIIGRSCIVAPAHVEGTCIAKAWRGGTILKQLMEAIEVEAKAEGISQLLAYAGDERVANYLQRLSYKKMPLTIWEKRLLCP